MADAKLKIVVGGDVSNAVKEFKSLDYQILTVKKDISLLTKELASLDPSNVKGINAISGELSAAKAELKSLEAQTKTASSAFVSGFQKSFGVVRQLAQILPGIGIAGIFGLAADAVAQLVGELANAASRVNVLKQANDNLQKSFAEAEGKVAGEVFTLKDLVAIAQDETLSRAARQQAIDKINKSYDTLLPNLTLENIKTKEVQASIDKLTDSLIRQAKIKGAQDLISKETAKQLELLTEVPQESLTFLDKVDLLFTRIGTLNPNAAPLEILNKGLERQSKVIQDSKTSIEVYNNALKKLLGEEAEAGTLFGDKTKDKIKAIGDALTAQISILEKTKASLKDIDLITGISEQIATLKIQKVNLEVKKGIITSAQAKDAIDAINKELGDVFQKQAISREAIKIKPHIQLERVDLLNTDVDTGASTEARDKIEKSIEQSFSKFPLSIHDVSVRIFGLKFTVQKEKAEAAIAEFNQSINSIVSKGIVDLGTNVGKTFGETLGNLFSGDIGDTLKKAGQALVNILGSVLEQIGEQVIAAALLAIQLKLALKSIIISPGTALAVGIGLVALGEVLKNLKFDVPKFAEGGIVTGATLGILGEKGPEAIMPIDKLFGLINSVSNQDNATSIMLGIRRNELVAWLRRGDTNFDKMF